MSKLFNKTKTGIVVALILFVCMASFAALSKGETDDMMTYSNKVISYNRWVTFPTLEDAIEHADIIIIGDIIDVKPAESIQTGYKLDKDGNFAEPLEKIMTPVEVKVTKALKGNVKEGDKITIHQSGGIYSDTLYEVDGVKLYKDNSKHLFLLNLNFFEQDCTSYICLPPMYTDVQIVNGKTKHYHENVFIPENITENELIELVKANLE